MPERLHRAIIAARRLAARAREDASASDPRVDIEKLVKHHAHCSATHLPHGYAAVVVHGDGRKRPWIHINPAYAEGPLRRRATQAHTLAHILLGWHVGLCGCEHADGSLPALPARADGDSSFQDAAMCQEREADAFARELMVPRSWLRSILDADAPAATVRNVRTVCEVPAAMAAAAVSDELPPGHVWAVAVHGHIRRSGTSPGTTITPPPLGAPIDTPHLVRDVREHHMLTLEDRVLHWWSLDYTVDHQSAAARGSTISASDVLASILEDLALRSVDAHQASSQLTAITGWAIGERPAGTTEELVTLVRSRITGLDGDVAIHLRDACDHPLIEDYLNARAAHAARVRHHAS